LTDRELEVASLGRGRADHYSIAERLAIAPRTAETHIDKIRRKLKVHSRAEIATWFTEQRRC
jgi:DNA-binding CsgD family transcriptional regulator